MHPQATITSHIIDLPLFSEVIQYDLEQLDANPQAIIFLLSLTVDQKGLWMLVAAFYRAKKNVAAAVAVLEAFVKQMTDKGCIESGLKPAFVLLSGCEMDLVHEQRTASQISSKASEHYQRAENWLRRAYGTDPPLWLMESGSHEQSTLTGAPDKPGTPKSLRAAQMEAPIQQEGRRERILEREVQMLRDKQAEQTTELERVRISKRQAESDFIRERSARRRAETRVEDLERDLEEAKRASREHLIAPGAHAHREKDKKVYREPLVPMKQSQYLSSRDSSHTEYGR